MNTIQNLLTSLSFKSINWWAPLDGGLLNYVYLKKSLSITNIMTDLFTAFHIERDFLLDSSVRKVISKEVLDSILMRPRVVLLLTIMMLLVFITFFALTIFVCINYRSCPNFFKSVRIIKKQEIKVLICIIKWSIIFIYISIIVCTIFEFAFLITTPKTNNVHLEDKSTVPFYAPAFNSSKLNEMTVYNTFKKTNNQSDLFYNQLSISYYSVVDGNLLTSFPLGFEDILSFLNESAYDLNFILPELNETSNSLQNVIINNTRSLVSNLTIASLIPLFNDSVFKFKEDASKISQELNNDSAVTKLENLKNSIISLNIKFKYIVSNLSRDLSPLCAQNSASGLYCGNITNGLSKLFIDINPENLTYPGNARRVFYMTFMSKLAVASTNMLTKLQQVSQLTEILDRELSKVTVDLKAMVSQLSGFFNKFYEIIWKNVKKTKDSALETIRFAIYWCIYDIPVLWIFFFIIIIMIIVITKLNSNDDGPGNSFSINYYYCSIIFAMFISLFIFFINSIVFFLVSVPILDVCRYTNPTTSNFTNIFLIKKLEQLVESYDIDKNLTPEMKSILHVKIPDNMINNLIQNCKPSLYLPNSPRTGLLPGLGFNSFIQLDLVNYFPGYAAELDRAINDLGQLFKPLIGPSMISPTFKDSYSTLLKHTMIYDSDIKIKTTYGVLTVSKFGLNTFDEVRENLRALLSSKLDPNLRDHYNNVSLQLRNLDDLEKSVTDFLLMKEPYLQIFGSLTERQRTTQDAIEMDSSLGKLNDLLVGNEFAIKLLSKTVKKSIDCMVYNITEKLQPTIDKFFLRTMPCARIYRAYDGIVSSICDVKFGFLVRYQAFLFWSSLFLGFSIILLSLIAFTGRHTNSHDSDALNSKTMKSLES